MRGSEDSRPPSEDATVVQCTHSTGCSTCTCWKTPYPKCGGIFYIGSIFCSGGRREIHVQERTCASLVASIICFTTAGLRGTRDPAVPRQNDENKSTSKYIHIVCPMPKRFEKVVQLCTVAFWDHTAHSLNGFSSRHSTIQKQKVKGGRQDGLEPPLWL